MTAHAPDCSARSGKDCDCEESDGPSEAGPQDDAPVAAVRSPDDYCGVCGKATCFADGKGPCQDTASEVTRPIRAPRGQAAGAVTLTGAAAAAMQRFQLAAGVLKRAQEQHAEALRVLTEELTR